MTPPLPILLELQYLPPVQYFSLLAKHPVALIEQHENYVKGSYRNRCHVACVFGVQRLSIPLKKGKHQQLPIREVRIAYDEPWQMQHWRTIQSGYGKSPFYEHYADVFHLFFEKKHEFLFDLNYELLVTVLKLLRLKPEIRFTEKSPCSNATRAFLILT